MYRQLWAIPAILLGLHGVVLSAEVDTVAPATEVTVRTLEPIQVRHWDRGRIYSAEVARNVYATDGDLAFPRGAMAELTVRELGDGDLALDLESVIADGRRFMVPVEPLPAETGERRGIGENRRTAQYLGGGALIGSIIGAIAGGGKGAAIGAAAGAAAGAGAQVMTRGRELYVPAETLLTFRLDRPLRYVEGADGGYMRNGHHYHEYRDYRNYPDNRPDNRHYEPPPR